MVFHNPFVKVFKQSLGNLGRIFTLPVEIALRAPSRLPKEELGLLNPVKSIETIMDDPAKAAKIGNVLGDALEVIGLLTLQPEIGAAGLAVKTGSDLIAPVAKVGQAVKDKDLGAVVSALGGLGTQLAGLSKLEEAENTKLLDISAKLSTVGKFITNVDDKLQISNKLLKQEIKVDITNNEQMKEFIQENHGQNEALKHGQVILDNDLQALKTEELKEEDVLNQIRTTLDIPATNSDFVKDIENFNNPKAILEYLAENLLAVEGLEQSQLNVILDLALKRGVLNAI